MKSNVLKFTLFVLIFAAAPAVLNMFLHEWFGQPLEMNGDKYLSGLALVALLYNVAGFRSWT